MNMNLSQHCKFCVGLMCVPDKDTIPNIPVQAHIHSHTHLSFTLNFCNLGFLEILI